MTSLRNEIAKRYTFKDWLKSRRVASMMDLKNSDQLIAELISTGKPGLVGRLGGTEARFIGEFLKLEQRSCRFRLTLDTVEKFSYRWNKRKFEILNNAGFFPSDWRAIRRFTDLNLEALEATDVLGAWGTAFAWPEGFALGQPVLPKVTLIDFTAPWVDVRTKGVLRQGVPEYSHPWSLSLEGKRVLVVSGFSKSISTQHLKHQLIFPGKRLPKFDLQVINVPLMMGRESLDGVHWFGVLSDLMKEIEAVEFDIALISAGAFSLPLAHHAKKIGRIGIHTGGALQLFFGIMGNRWNTYNEVTSLINEHWTRPLPEERPSNALSIEDSCYW